MEFTIGQRVSYKVNNYSIKNKDNNRYKSRDYLGVIEEIKHKVCMVRFDGQALLDKPKPCLKTKLVGISPQWGSAKKGISVS